MTTLQMTYKMTKQVESWMGDMTGYELITDHDLIPDQNHSYEYMGDLGQCATFVPRYWTELDHRSWPNTGRSFIDMGCGTMVYRRKITVDESLPPLDLKWPCGHKREAGASKCPLGFARCNT